METPDFVVTRSEISAATTSIAGHVRRTPMLRLADGPRPDGFPAEPVDVKLEYLQVTGSFKPRGAFSLLLQADDRPDGVVAASGGNFGLAVAYAAGRLGIHSTIFVPETSPPEKISHIAGFGADVHVVAGFYPDAFAASQQWAARHDALVAHAYDDRHVVAGQGSCGVEITEQAPDVDTVVVAVGGGGLIGGIASWVGPDVRVVAVETEGTPALHAARAAGGPVRVEVGGIAASSLGASQIGDHAWAANRWIDESVLVTDTDVAEAQRWLWSTARIIAEPGAATPVAALRCGAYRPAAGERVVLVICGANVNPASVVP